MDIILDSADRLMLDCWWSRIFPINYDEPKSFDPIVSSLVLTKARTTQCLNLLNQATISCNSDLDCYFSGDELQSHPHQVLRKCLITGVLNPNLNTTIASSHQQCLSRFGRDHLFRQSLSIFVIVFVGISFIYFFLSTLSYFFIFDHRLKNHPKYLRDQIKLEIACALKAFGPIDILALPLHLAQVRGHSKLYDDVSDIKGISCFTLAKPVLDFFNLTETFRDNSRLLGPKASPWPPTHLSSYPILHDTAKQILSVLQNSFHHDFGGGWFYLILSCFLFLIFTDLAYLIHRFEHHPLVYKHIHKTHHKWVIPTPYASYAFHPLDGFLQSLPYNVFIFIFPFHRVLYLFAFFFITVWTILIHDSELIVGHRLESYINSPSHHTLHHLYFNCNFGQYCTWTDRLFSTYRHPNLDDKLALDSKKHKPILHKIAKIS
uniref:C-5 sterol desaturase n=1 Tax=Puccinia striiformis f. sp. tritici TaxID=168172 RepID=G3JX02_9BASI|nr:C-5 sterol desaturase [Puccinia striiformis f. sp. tritici]